jgi:hypothetical protein
MRYFLLFLCLTACGFKPMLAKNNDGYRMLDEVRIAKVEGRDSLRLKRIILENFDPHPHSLPLYDLNISIAYETSSQGILKDSLTTRYRVKVTLNYSLIDADTKEVMDQANIYLYSSYNVAESEFMNYMSERYVSDNILKELCNDLKSRLNLVLSTRSPSKLSENSY